MYNLQAMAVGVGCTYDQATGDLKGATFASMKAGKIDFRRLTEQLQQHVVIPSVCERTWDRFVSRAVLAGYLPDRSEPYRAQWVTPAWEPINPNDDIEADIKAVRTGRMPPQEFVAAWGNDWRKVQDQTRAFYRRADSMGLAFDIDPRRTDQSGKQQRSTAIRAAASRSPSRTTPASRSRRPPPTDGIPHGNLEDRAARRCPGRLRAPDRPQGARHPWAPLPGGRAGELRRQRAHDRVDPLRGSDVVRWYGTERLSTDEAAVCVDRLASSGIPFLDSHNSYGIGSVLGRIVDVWFAEGRILGGPSSPPPRPARPPRAWSPVARSRASRSATASMPGRSPTPTAR